MRYGKLEQYGKLDRKIQAYTASSAGAGQVKGPRAAPQLTPSGDFAQITGSPIPKFSGKNFFTNRENLRCLLRRSGATAHHAFYALKLGFLPLGRDVGGNGRNGILKTSTVQRTVE